MNTELVSSMSLMIYDIQRFSIHDGPGIRTTVFLKGCPLECPWCQNPEGINPEQELTWDSNKCINALECIKACEENALELTERGIKIDREKCTRCGKCAYSCPTKAIELIGKKHSNEDLLWELLKDSVFYEKSGGGVTFSGGEPLMQASSLGPVLADLNKKGIHVAIETCGNCSWDSFERVLKSVDLIIYDLKFVDPKKIKETVGGDPNLILGNLKLLSSLGIPTWIRTPIIPGFTKDENNVKQISEFIVQNIPTAKKFELLSFNKLCASKYERLGIEWELNEVPMVTKEEMDQLRKVAEKTGVEEVIWSGPSRAG